MNGNLLPKSVTRTLRIDQALDRALSKRAQSERVSVNFLVGRCIRRFIEWDAPVSEFGMVSAPRLMLDELITAKDGDALERLGRQVAREFLKPATEFIMGEFTTEGAAEILRRAALYGRRFGFDFGDGRDDRSWVIVLRHEQGAKWARYYAGLLDETFRVLLGRTMKIASTDTLCVAQLPVQHAAVEPVKPSF